MELTPAPAPSAFPASAGSVARAWPGPPRAPGCDGLRLGRFRLARRDCCAALGGLGADRRLRRRAAASLSARHRACGLRHAARRRRPRAAPAPRSPAAAGLVARRRPVSILIEIVAHPVASRHEANDPPVAGIDHQPPVIAAAVDHRQWCRRGRAAAEFRAAKTRSRARPCRPRSAAAASARSAARDFPRHRRIGTVDIGDGRVRRTRRPHVAPKPGHSPPRPVSTRPGRHDPSCEQLHRPSLL